MNCAAVATTGLQLSPYPPNTCLSSEYWSVISTLFCKQRSSHLLRKIDISCHKDFWHDELCSIIKSQEMSLNNLAEAASTMNLVHLTLKYTVGVKMIFPYGRYLCKNLLTHSFAQKTDSANYVLQNINLYGAA